MSNLHEIIQKLESTTGFTNLRISQLRNGTGWAVYRRYRNRNNEWQTIFVGRINLRGEIRINRVNNKLLDIIDTSVLPSRQPEPEQENQEAEQQSIESPWQ